MTRRPWAAALAAGFALLEGGACSLPLGTEEPLPAEVGDSRIVHGIPVTVRVRDADLTRARAAIDVAFAAAEETAGKLLAGLTGYIGWAGFIGWGLIGCRCRQCRKR